MASIRRVAAKNNHKFGMEALWPIPHGLDSKLNGPDENDPKLNDPELNGKGRCQRLASLDVSPGVTQNRRYLALAPWLVGRGIRRVTATGCLIRKEQLYAAFFLFGRMRRIVEQLNQK
jgi:hypothetical protein